MLLDSELTAGFLTRIWHTPTATTMNTSKFLGYISSGGCIVEQGFFYSSSRGHFVVLK